MLNIDGRTNQPTRRTGTCTCTSSEHTKIILYIMFQKKIGVKLWEGMRSQDTHYLHSFIMFEQEKVLKFKKLDWIFKKITCKSDHDKKKNKFEKRDQCKTVGGFALARSRLPIQLHSRTKFKMLKNGKT